MDGYKDLLLKQRDIMMALTKRLSERDELIMSLQEELDAYDAAQRRLEDDLDHRTAEVIAMRKAAIEEVRLSLTLARDLGLFVHLSRPNDF